MNWNIVPRKLCAKVVPPMRHCLNWQKAVRLACNSKMRKLHCPEPMSDNFCSLSLSPTVTCTHKNISNLKLWLGIMILLYNLLINSTPTLMCIHKYSLSLKLWLKIISFLYNLSINCIPTLACAHKNSLSLKLWLNIMTFLCNLLINCVYNKVCN